MDVNWIQKGCIEESLLMGLGKEKGFSNGIKGRVMMGCGKLVWRTGMEFGRVQQEIRIKDNGKQISNKGMEYIVILIAFMKDNLWTFWNMVKENSNLPMVIHTKVNTFLENQINGGFTIGKAATNTKVNSKTVSVMVTEH